MKRLVVSGNQTQDVWFELPVRCHSATCTGQPHPPCSTYRGLWRACGYLVVVAQCKALVAQARYPGFDSWQVSSLSSIFASVYLHDYFFMHVVCFIKEIFTSSVIDKLSSYLSFRALIPAPYIVYFLCSTCKVLTIVNFHPHIYLAQDNVLRQHTHTHTHSPHES